jgi:Subunit ChlI of Mg-chelatase
MPGGCAVGLSFVAVVACTFWKSDRRHRRREPLAGTLRKEGPGLDLPGAMGLFAATAQVLAAGLEGWVFAGELSLQGGLVSTPGVVSVAIASARERPPLARRPRRTHAGDLAPYADHR